MIRVTDREVSDVPYRHPVSLGSMTLAIKRFPGEARSRRHTGAVRRRRELNQPHTTEGCPPSLAFYHWSRYGAPGEQQHLPDWLDTTAAKNGALAPLYNDL
jgi:hypothetical protein